MKRFFAVVVIALAVLLGYFLGARSAQSSQPSDLSLRDMRAATAVRTAISLNKHLDGTGITVEVNEGRATLGGSVHSTDQRQLAEAIAQSIEGVDDVTNVVSVDPPALAEAPDDRSRSLGERLDDLTTATRVRAALALHKDIDRGDVNVELHKGTATLTGTVPTWAARELAAKVAEDVEGVRVLNNQIQIEGEDQIDVVTSEGDIPEDRPWGSDRLRVPQQLTDGAIKLQIEASLRMKPQIDSRLVDVEVVNGVVHLTGDVSNATEGSLIEKVAEDCWGVTKVINDLVTESTPEPSSEDLVPTTPGQ